MRTPSWFDLRLVLGVVLVIASVAIGAAVVSGGDSARPMLALDNALSAGTVLDADDVHTVRVRLAGSAASYVAPGTDVSGRVLRRDVGAGELLPAAALGAAEPEQTSLTVPVKPENAPQVARGDRVAIWVSTSHCGATAVLDDVVVQDVRQAGSGALSAASSESLVVQVARPLALRVVTALGLDGATIRVGVVSGTTDPTPEAALPDLSTCLAPKST